jgi:hypothetical protein
MLQHNKIKVKRLTIIDMHIPAFKIYKKQTPYSKNNCCWKSGTILGTSVQLLGLRSSAEKPLDGGSSGSVSSPRAAAAGGAWVHAPPQRKSKRIGGSGTVSSPIPFPVGGEDHRHLQQEKNTQTTIDFKFFFYPDPFLGLVCCFLFLQATDLTAEEGDNVCGGGAGGRRRINLGLWAPLCSGWS